MAEKENENSFEESTFDRRFKEIVGIACPPEKEEQWCVVLQYAGYSMTEIHSILSTLGYPGYKEAGELPDAWVSKYNNATKYQQLTFDQSPCGEIPQFSPDLLRRLESAFAEKGPLSWSGEPRDAGATSQREDQSASTPVEMGISLFDVAFALEEDDIAATDLVKKWIDSKRISAETIGKCPRDGRKHLYRLSELVADVQKIASLTSRDKSRLREVLTSRQRAAR